MSNQIKVRGGIVHKVDGGYVISDSGGWLAGVYDSIESAKLGIKNRSKDNWCFLENLRNKINIDENRSINIEDLK